MRNQFANLIESNEEFHSKHPIVLIEDDLDDQYVFTSAIEDLGYINPIVILSDGSAALNYFDTTSDVPFIIICDINIPKINGIELRKILLDDSEKRRRFVPFIYFSTTYSQDLIDQAQDLSVQGFFIKEKDFSGLKESIQLLYIYWNKCKFLTVS
jgi:CheY-like chemotaxis protein